MSAKRRHTQQTISWFYDLYKRELLDLDPPYQRRSVWNQQYKEEFIDTVLSQFPAPAIFLYEEITPEGRSSFHVVDGKQRLSCIFEFVSGVFTISEASPNVAQRGKYFSQLSADEKVQFWTYEFTVEYLPTNEESLINQIFERINKNTAKLSRQELRHARFSGRFITVAENLTSWMFAVLPESFPRLDSQSRRQMKDVELVANLLLLIEEGVQGYSQDQLDEAFSSRDASWEDEGATEERFREVVKFVGDLAKMPVADPLYKTRLRNQADFYSLFGAVNDLLEMGHLPAAATEILSAKVRTFIASVEDPAAREGNTEALAYFTAARSNSNDLRPRTIRIDIISGLLNTAGDNPQQS